MLADMVDFMKFTKWIKIVLFELVIPQENQLPLMSLPKKKTYHKYD